MRGSNLQLVLSAGKLTQAKSDDWFGLVPIG